jgi:hypothetical protein
VLVVIEGEQKERDEIESLSSLEEDKLFESSEGGGGGPAVFVFVVNNRLIQMLNPIE